MRVYVINFYIAFKPYVNERQSLSHTRVPVNCIRENNEDDTLKELHLEDMLTF